MSLDKVATATLDSAQECCTESNKNYQNFSDDSSEKSFEVLRIVDGVNDGLLDFTSEGDDSTSILSDEEDEHFSKNDGTCDKIADESNLVLEDVTKHPCSHETNEDNTEYEKCSNAVMNNHASEKFQVKNDAHRQKYRKLRRIIILYEAFLIISICKILKPFILFVLGFAILNKVVLFWEFRSLQLKGERVHVGHGQNMFIHCVGEGKPTVILDAPTGSSSTIWSTALPQISKLTKVCVYDRAGLGFSDPPPRYDDNLNIVMWLLGANTSTEFDLTIGTVSRMVDDLRNIINIAKPLPKPYVLVGSGVSSLVARYFAQKYPGDVTSIVLVDPVNENLCEMSPFSSFWSEIAGPYLKILYLPFTCIVSRMANFLWLWKSELLSTSEESMAIEKYQMHLPSHLISAQNEFLRMDTSIFQIRELSESNSFPQNISVAVLNTHGIEMCTKDSKNVPQGSDGFPERYFNPHPECKQLQNNEENLKEFFRKPNVLVDHIHELVNKWRMLHDSYASKILKGYEKMQNTVTSYMTFNKA